MRLHILFDKHVLQHVLAFNMYLTKHVVLTLFGHITHVITWYNPLHMNPVHSLLTEQFAWPWFCKGSVRSSSFAHIWHSARCRFSSKLVTHENCWMMMTNTTTRPIFMFWCKNILDLNIWNGLCNRDENFFRLSFIWVGEAIVSLWYLICIH